MNILNRAILSSIELISTKNNMILSIFAINTENSEKEISTQHVVRYREKI